MKTDIKTCTKSKYKYAGDKIKMLSKLKRTDGEF